MESAEGSMAWGTAQSHILQVSRAWLLVSPRQVWDVQHSRMATVHMEKWQRMAVAVTVLCCPSIQHRLVINTASGKDAQTEI